MFARMARSLNKTIEKLQANAGAVLIPAAVKLDDAIEKNAPRALSRIADISANVSDVARRAAEAIENSSMKPAQLEADNDGYILCNALGCKTKLKASYGKFCNEHREEVPVILQPAYIECTFPSCKTKILSTYGHTCSTHSATGSKAEQAPLKQHYQLEKSILVVSDANTIDASRTEQIFAHEVLQFCKWKNCIQRQDLSGDYCAIHQREYDQLKARKCGQKDRHLTLEIAQEHATDMSRRRGEQMNAYSCPFCNFFHIGHSKLNRAN